MAKDSIWGDVPRQARCCCHTPDSPFPPPNPPPRPSGPPAPSCLSPPPRLHLSKLSAHKHHGQARRSHIGGVPEPCRGGGMGVGAAATKLVHGIAVLLRDRE